MIGARDFQGCACITQDTVRSRLGFEPLLRCSRRRRLDVRGAHNLPTLESAKPLFFFKNQTLNNSEFITEREPRLRFRWNSSTRASLAPR
jgi:hypothetical protein